MAFELAPVIESVILEYGPIVLQHGALLADKVPAIWDKLLNNTSYIEKTSNLEQPTDNYSDNNSNNNSSNKDPKKDKDDKERERERKIKQLEENREKGRQGEIDAGIDPEVKKEHITSPTKTAEYRIPDKLDKTKKILTEVKNTQKLSYTKQLRDFNLWAKSRGYKFVLKIRPDVKLSDTLKAEINNKNIVIEIIGE